MIAVIAIGAILFIATYLYKPELLLILFFTLTISSSNFYLPGMELNFRPLLGLIVLLWSFTGKRKLLCPPFLSIVSNQLIICFFFYLLLLSWGTGSLSPKIAGFISLSMITAYLGYFSFSLKGNAYYIKLSLILAGLLCFFDLIYTYVEFGTFPVQRILNYFIQDTIDPTEELANHNFFGFICGISFVLILSDYINKRLISKPLIYLLPVMFLGVIMSTSRSTLLGLIVVTLFLIIMSLRHSADKSRTYKILSIAVVIIILVPILFFSAQSLFHLESAFIDNITSRLTEEPIAVIRKNLGYSYDIHHLESMDWREESASIAYNVFMRLPFQQQFFGIGIGGYLQRNLGHNGLNPHNGILYMLLETGIFGSCFYLFILVRLIYQNLISKYLSSLLLILMFIIFYSLGQNEEMISATSILFIIALGAENAFPPTPVLYSLNA